MSPASPGAVSPHPTVRVVPANEASWEDLQTVMGTRGDAHNCQCQGFKIRDIDWRGVPREERSERLREQADDGVWVVPCFQVWVGFRRMGISGALARAPSKRRRVMRVEF